VTKAKGMLLSKSEKKKRLRRMGNNKLDFKEIEYEGAELHQNSVPSVWARFEFYRTGCEFINEFQSFYTECSVFVVYVRVVHNTM
jgi:hypothetical protein